MATPPPRTTAYLLESRSSSSWIDVELELGEDNLRCLVGQYSQWVDEELGLSDFEARLSAGEPVAIFDFRRDRLAITWRQWRTALPDTR